MDRMLNAVKTQHATEADAALGRTLLRIQIPVRSEHLDVEKPGYIEVDTIVQCREV